MILYKTGHKSANSHEDVMKLPIITDY